MKLTRAKSGIYGVHQRKGGKWQAQVWSHFEGKPVWIYLGRFVTARAAEAAVDRAVKTLGKTPYDGAGIRIFCKQGHFMGPANRELQGRCQKCIKRYQREYFQQRKTEEAFKARRRETNRRYRAKKKAGNC